MGPGPITGAGASIDPLLNATDYRGRKREEGGGAKEVNKIGKRLHLALDVAILEGGAFNDISIWAFSARCHYIEQCPTSSAGHQDT